MASRARSSFRCPIIGSAERRPLFLISSRNNCRGMTAGSSLTSSHYVNVLRSAADKLGVMLQLERISDPDQFDGAFASMVAARAQALIVVVDPLTVRYRDRIVELAMRNRLPAMYGFREFVDAGGLIAYGVNVPYLCRRAAV
jgi:ABC-type uncharacterized transport system substrate-binding protein